MSALTYASYLRLDDLLTLQRPLSRGPEPDEMLFIVIHQVSELWFKQLLHEGVQVRRAFTADQTPHVLATLRRMCSIFKTLVMQMDVLETMTPLSFGAFRTQLQSASGFQSVQFRQLEFFFGQRDTAVLKHYPPESPERALLARSLVEPSLYQSFVAYLGRRGYPVVDAQPDPRMQAIFIDIYRHNPELSGLCERLVDLDEGFQEWRYRHVQMVQRTLGAKIGTGGTEGGQYLRNTLFRPLFADLWTMRSAL